MSRPIKIEFSGALYHVTSRGDRREKIYDDDTDMIQFLGILRWVVADFNWVCHAYCLMTNHYHLVIETPDANLSKGMRQLNGIFTQTSKDSAKNNFPLSKHVMPAWIAGIQVTWMWKAFSHP